MTFVIIHGLDGSGKSIQTKSILEASDLPEIWSFATKNRKLYAESEIEPVELLVFNPDATVNPYKTMDAFKSQVDKTIKENAVKLLVIDEITLLRKWAQPVVLEDLNRSRRGTDKPMLTKIGENNYAAWEQVNKLVYGELERLANWAVINDATVIAITSMVEERRLVQDDFDGKTKSVTTGKWIIDARLNVRKLSDLIIRVEKDGSKGKGYYAIIEKSQDWMKPRSDNKDYLKIDKNTLMNEMVSLGWIEI